MEILKSIYVRLIVAGALSQRFFDFLTGWPIGFFITIFIFSFLFERAVVKIMAFFDYKVADFHQHIGIGVLGFSFFILVMLFAGICEEKKEKWNDSNLLVK